MEICLEVNLVMKGLQMCSNHFLAEKTRLKSMATLNLKGREMTTSKMAPVVMPYAAISLMMMFRPSWDPGLPSVSPEMTSYSGVVLSPRREYFPVTEVPPCLPAAVCLSAAYPPVAPCLPAASLMTDVRTAAPVTAAAEVAADVIATVVAARLAE